VFWWIFDRRLFFPPPNPYSAALWESTSTEISPFILFFLSFPFSFCVS